MERSKYGYVVCADIRYLPELVGNLNSLSMIGNEEDILVFGRDIPAEVQSQFGDLNYRVIYREVTDEEFAEGKHLSDILCRKRYWYAAKYAIDYDAVCILDADMIWSHLPTAFFEIAAKTGLAVGPCKEQNKIYSDEHHKWHGEWIIPEGFYNYHDLCNSPLFIDPRVWEAALTKQWEIFLDGQPDDNFKAPDMDAMNICMLEQHGIDRILPLPSLMFLGVNEQLLKPYIRAVQKEDGLWTQSGIKIYSIHGHFGHANWRGIQLGNRKGCIEGQLNGSESAYRQAQSSLDTMVRAFYDALEKGPIDIELKNYRHPESPAELYEGIESVIPL